MKLEIPAGMGRDGKATRAGRGVETAHVASYTPNLGPQAMQFDVLRNEGEMGSPRMAMFGGSGQALPKFDRTTRRNTELSGHGSGSVRPSQPFAGRGSQNRGTLNR